MKIHSASRFVVLPLLAGLFAAVSSPGAWACAACYGDTSGSKMANAADVGIIAMVFIMFGMLAAVGAFMWHLAYRAKHPLPDYNELLQEDVGPAQPQPQPEAL
jgi:hypothetical protein